MRVLHLVPGDGSGHSMIFVRRQIAGLPADRVESRTVFLTERLSVGGLLRGRRLLREALREFRPEALHAEYGTITAFLAACTWRGPLVITFRGSDLNPNPGISVSRSIAGRLLSQLSALRATCIVCVAPELRQRLWWRRSRATVVPSGLDTDLFHPIDKGETRAALGWSDSERVVVFNAGKDPAVKDLPLAEAVVEAAHQAGVAFRFLVMDGNTDPDMVPVILNASDALLVTSRYEGSPNIVKEAMAYNLPVVAVPVGDITERLAKVSPTWIVPRDARALGAALCAALQESRRSNGFDQAQDLSLDRQARRLADIYNEAIASPARGRGIQR